MGNKNVMKTTLGAGYTVTHVIWYTSWNSQNIQEVSLAWAQEYRCFGIYRAEGSVHCKAWWKQVLCTFSALVDKTDYFLQVIFASFKLLVCATKESAGSSSPPVYDDYWLLFVALVSSLIVIFNWMPEKGTWALFFELNHFISFL